MKALLQRPALRQSLWLALIVLLLAAGAGQIQRRFGWDNTYYLAMTSSLVEDGDFDLRNDVLHVPTDPSSLLRMLQTTVPGGSLANTFAVGTPLLWTPAYLLARVLSSLGGAGAARWGGLAIALLHLLSLGVMAVVVGFLDRLLRRAGARRSTAFVASLALLTGTAFLVYAVRDYTMSHLANLLAACWFVAALFAAQEEAARRRGVRWSTALLAGGAFGFLFLTRWQSLTMGLLLAPLAVQLWRTPESRRRMASLAAAFAAGFAVLALLQLRGWRLEFGSWLTIPQGSGYMRWTQPDLFRFLFSGLNGLLWWSPIFFLGVLGLLLPWRAKVPQTWRWAALAVLLLDVWANAAATDWWGGAAYAGRRMTSDLPLLALGLGNLARSRVRRMLPGLLILLAAYGVFTHGLFSRGVQDLELAVLGRPADAPGAEREFAMVHDPVQARAALRASPLPFHHLDYFQAARGRTGGVLTYLAMLAACMAAAAVARAPARSSLTWTLGALLAWTLLLQLRLTTGTPPDLAERHRWQAHVRALRAAEERPTGSSPFDDTPPAALRDAYALVDSYTAFAQGDGERGTHLLASLRAYPFARELAAEGLPPDHGTVLWAIPGVALHATGLRSGRPLSLRQAAPSSALIARLRFFLRDRPDAAPHPVLTLQGDEWQVALSLDPNGSRLVAVPGIASEALPPWESGDWESLELSFDPTSRQVRLRASHPGGPVRELVVTAPGTGAPARLWLGDPRRGAGAGKALPGSRWENVRVLAEDEAARPGAPPAPGS